MKICLINNLFPPYARGGAETVVENQARELTEQGHDVFIITAKPLFSRHETSDANPKIYRFYPLNIISYYHLAKLPLLLRALWRLLDVFNFHGCFKIKNILKKENPDIIYSHNLTGLGYVLPSLFRRVKIHYVQTIHDAALIRPSGLLMLGNEKETIFIKIYFALTRWLFNSPDEIIYPSAWLKKYYDDHRFFPLSKKIVKPNFDLPAVKPLLGQPLKNKNLINFLFIGQIESHKGIIFLIEVFNKLTYDLRLTTYDLRLIGSGNDMNDAKKLASSNPHIIFFGHVASEKITKYMAMADYLIVPSLCYENSPTVIFEALRVGVPVIASNLGGIPELIKDNQNGYLFRAGDKTAMMAIIKKIFDQERQLA